ncbi:hypothetical protein ACTFIV_010329 [Dictyostelium citrinum]
MSTKETLQQKHKSKLKGAFTHEEVKEKLKKRCIDALKEKRKTEIEKARNNLLNNNSNNNNNNNNTNNIITSNLKFTLQDELMKLKNEQSNKYNNVNNNVNLNGSESSTPESKDNNNNNGGVEKYGNSVEFEDIDFEINQNDIDNANKALEDNNDVGVEDDEDYSYLETYTLTPEEELQLLQEIQDLLDQDEDESLRIYHEMEKLQNDEIESYLSNK